MFEKEIKYFVDSYHDCVSTGGVPYGEMVVLYSGRRGGKSIFDETDYLDSIEIYNKFKKTLTRIENGNIITSAVDVKPSKLLNNLIGRI